MIIYRYLAVHQKWQKLIALLSKNIDFFNIVIYLLIQYFNTSKE